MSQVCKHGLGLQHNCYKCGLEKERDELQAELTKEREANKELRKGLEWYAAPKTWQLGVTITLGSAHPHPEPIKSDRGKRARAILEGNEPNG